MKAELTEFSSVPIEKVDADKGMPFPLYIYLKLNGRLVPLRHEGDALYTKRDDLIKFNLKELWTPIYYYDRFKELLGLKPKSEEAQLVRDVLLSQELPQEIKAQALTALSKDILSSLHQVTGDSLEAKEEGLKKCKEVADEILTVAAAHDSVYDEVLAMRSVDEIEHSVAVGSVAAMFAMSLGNTDEMVLADIIMASIFHDIGLVHIDHAVRSKPEMERSKDEDLLYRTHVDKSVEVLRNTGKNINERVYTMISQHHEKYDGSGYPKGLKGEQLDELSQILNLADWFDNLTLGNLTGSVIPPAEALDYIYESASAEKSTEQRINPELIERLFQFMAEQKDFFERKKQEMQSKVEEQAKGVTKKE